MDPQFAIMGVGAGVALAAYAVLAQVDERKAIRESLRHLEGLETVNDTRDRELLNPLRDRAITPVLGAMTRVGRKYTPMIEKDQKPPLDYRNAGKGKGGE